MSKIISFNKNAQGKILSSVKKLTDAVSVTMGPEGKNVVIEKLVGAPIITKDGVTVARELVLDDPTENVICKLVKEAAGRTASVAGDGTTTATVLTDEILNKVASLMESGEKPIIIRDGLSWTCNKLLKNLDSIAFKNPTKEDLINIATISTNNDKKLGEVVGTAYHYAGKDGTVVAEAHYGVDTSVKELDGVTIKNGYDKNYAFLNKKDTQEIVLDNCAILLVRKKLESISDNLKIFEDLNTSGKSLLIVSEGISQEAKDELISLNKDNKIRLCIINYPPAFCNYDAKEDLSILTSANMCSPHDGVSFETLTLEDLGFAQKVVIDRFSTQIFKPSIMEIKRASKLVNYEHDMQQPISDTDRIKVKERISFLKCVGALISVGYETEVELREKGDRIEDALHATYAAITEGILPGGGVALIKAADMLMKDQDSIPKKYITVAHALASACTRPLRQIMFNASETWEDKYEQIVKNENDFYGYNLVDGEYQDLLKTGVVDPLKVTQSALKNAVSISVTLGTTALIMAERPDDPSEHQMPAGWRPPEQGKLNHKY